MGLFNKHKKFPKYPKSSSSSLPKLPSYESEPKGDSDKPSYYEAPEEHHKEPKFDGASFPVPKEEKLDTPDFHEDTPSFHDLGDLDIPTRTPGKFELRNELPQEIMESRETSYSPSANLSGNDPIFVRLDDYKKAVKSIATIRDKLDDAEDLLGEILEIKKEEDQQISHWHREITEIKNKLMEVDKDLFEVHK